ncbi:hypothetical protein MRX96_014393 [Rhipicephalus microplus]
MAANACRTSTSRSRTSRRQRAGVSRAQGRTGSRAHVDRQSKHGHGGRMGATGGSRRCGRRARGGAGLRRIWVSRVRANGGWTFSLAVGSSTGWPRFGPPPRPSHLRTKRSLNRPPPENLESLFTFVRGGNAPCFLFLLRRAETLCLAPAAEQGRGYPRPSFRTATSPSNEGPWCTPPEKQVRNETRRCCPLLAGPGCH